MKKSKILVVLLLGLLIAGGLVLASCGAIDCGGSCGRITASCSANCSYATGNSSSSKSNKGGKPCNVACN